MSAGSILIFQRRNAYVFLGFALRLFWLETAMASWAMMCQTAAYPCRIPTSISALKSLQMDPATCLAYALGTPRRSPYCSSWGRVWVFTPSRLEFGDRLASRNLHCATYAWRRCLIEWHSAYSYTLPSPNPINVGSYHAKNSQSIDWYKKEIFQNEQLMTLHNLRCLIVVILRYHLDIGGTISPRAFCYMTH